MIALALFYAFFLVFTGLCIDANHSFVSKKNPINAIAQSMNFTPIEAGVGGFLMLVLVSVYIVVFVSSIIYEIRYARVHGKKIFSIKMIGAYLLTLIACALLSVGLGLVLQTPLTPEKLANIFGFLLHNHRFR